MMQKGEVRADLCTGKCIRSTAYVNTGMYRVVSISMFLRTRCGRYKCAADEAITAARSHDRGVLAH